MAMEVKVMDMAQFAEILKSDQRSVSFAQFSSKLISPNVAYFHSIMEEMQRSGTSQV